MRITQNILISNFLRNLNNISQRMEFTAQQLATGKKFFKPSQAPIEVGQVIGYQSDISKFTQYLKNVNDGTSQMEYVDTIVQDLLDGIGRARELAIDSANDNLNEKDRQTIAQEISQIMNSTLSNANSRFRDRYSFAGWNTRTMPFEAVINERTREIEDVIFHGNRGNIDRLVGDSDLLSVNMSGKEIFLKQTYTRRGKVLPIDIPLKFSGSIYVNDIEFEMTAGTTLRQLAQAINGRSNDTHVFASIDTNRLVLESATATSEFALRDDQDNELLDNLGLYVSGAFNLAYGPSSLPLVDSTPAIFTGAGAVSTLAFDNTNNTMNIFLGADANGGISKSANIKISTGTYASVADLIVELQTQLDTAFGSGRLIVSDAGGGVLQIETVATGDEVNAGDLVIGGTINGLDDTASNSAGLNLIGIAGVPPATIAGTAGTDGNDKLIIDLGPTASKSGMDILPQIINIRAANTNTIDDLIDEIKYQIINNDMLRGAVEVHKLNGRILFETVRQGQDVKAEDFKISEGATGTLTALALSDIPIKANYTGSILGFPLLVVAGFNDKITIDIGPTVSIDGTNPDPVTFNITPGVYANINQLATEINNHIQASPVLNGTIEINILGPPGFQFLVLSSVNEGSQVRGSDFKISGSVLGTLGLSPGDAVSGGGASDGRGEELQPENIFNTLINLRDDNLGTAWKDTKLFDILNEDGDLMGFTDGDIITVTYDAGTFSFSMLPTDTLRDLVKNIQDILNTRAEVKLTGDGRISIRNLETYQIYNLSITAKSHVGEPRTIFNELFEEMPTEIPGLTTGISNRIKDYSRFDRLGDQDLVSIDNDQETFLRVEAIVGARANRLTKVYNLFTSSQINVEGLKLSVEASNYAEVITALGQQELILQSTLGVGARVLPPSLIDFLI